MACKCISILSSNTGSGEHRCIIIEVHEKPSIHLPLAQFTDMYECIRVYKLHSTKDASNKNKSVSEQGTNEKEKKGATRIPKYR